MLMERVVSQSVVRKQELLQDVKECCRLPTDHKIHFHCSRWKSWCDLLKDSLNRDDNKGDAIPSWNLGKSITGMSFTVKNCYFFKKTMGKAGTIQKTLGSKLSPGKYVLIWMNFFKSEMQWVDCKIKNSKI